MLGWSRYTGPEPLAIDAARENAVRESGYVISAEIERTKNVLLFKDLLLICRHGLKFGPLSMLGGSEGSFVRPAFGMYYPRSTVCDQRCPDNSPEHLRTQCQSG
jgi:hypothetical protein